MSINFNNITSIITTPKLELSGSSSGSVKVSPAAVSGSTILTLPTGTGTLISTTGGVTPGASGNVLTSNGTAWISGRARASLVINTVVTTNHYPTFVSTTSGDVTALNISNTKLFYKPSTGELQTTSLILNGSSSGTITLTAPSISGSTALYFPANSGNVETSNDDQTQLYTAYTTGGTSTAYTLTPNPAISSYVTGTRFCVTFHVTAGPYPTINISGLGAKNLMCYNNGAKTFVSADVAPTGWISDCFYDGTDFVMINIVARSFNQKAIFGFGYATTNITNLVTNTGVVANDVTGVGTSRYWLAASSYGGDKAIFGYGTPGSSLTNLVSNTGVVATDTAGVGTSRYQLAASSYGGDKAIFGYGTGGTTNITNLVSNTGVVANNSTGVGTARYGLAAASYGLDKAIFGYGTTGTNVSLTNIVSNTGVVSLDILGIGTTRYNLAAATYGLDKAIFGYGTTGSNVSLTNLVSNTGIVSLDIAGVGTARNGLAASTYGGDKAIFGYGQSAGGKTNLVTNTGIVSTDYTGVGTDRYGLAAAGFGI
ncbi:hypothetical protein UFOVP1666_79 [uncultured Caudovirales phage]|uniref:Uncharacterized protein n=1 Tax=uncultured Caudovirales phage TaxID=2100421 RepID=A0A6J5Q476_9CAUD|nr:hypothetical protein UFOVP867_34 [uncultured Caudovirales phage]CAB4171005.1 hypothetical protein UFOVP913_164 [uncultured Caudovirales phage]CAB4176318.1 hypothetical protein UFOVP993_20 [uncultured Caudovirales phage]CAB4223036.1 hypothetical protein UFOVP1666_79 [uncultured Caudovirales phage]